MALAVCAGGLRRLLIARGEQVPDRGIRAMVPVNLRDASGKFVLGNRVTALFVELPVAEQDPVARLQQIAAATKRLKQPGAGAGAALLMGIAALTPPVAVHAALAWTEFSRRMFNLTITHVPRTRHALYALGAPLRDVYPVVPLAAEHDMPSASRSSRTSAESRSGCAPTRPRRPTSPSLRVGSRKD